VNETSQFTSIKGLVLSWGSKWVDLSIERYGKAYDNIHPNERPAAFEDLLNSLQANSFSREDFLSVLMAVCTMCVPDNRKKRSKYSCTWARYIARNIDEIILLSLNDYEPTDIESLTQTICLHTGVKYEAPKNLNDEGEIVDKPKEKKFKSLRFGSMNIKTKPKLMNFKEVASTFSSQTSIDTDKESLKQEKMDRLLKEAFKIPKELEKEIFLVPDIPNDIRELFNLDENGYIKTDEDGNILWPKM
jgi:hypothetical protein